mgnify:CR=1 FL=1
MIQKVTLRLNDDRNFELVGALTLDELNPKELLLYATAKCAEELLPVIDNLERAIAAAQNTTDESLKVGVEMVYRQLCDCFTKRGITVIDRKGEPFDPKLENAVMQGTEEDGEPGTVCEVFQKGYRMGGKIIRNAMVTVTFGGPKRPAE